MFQSAVAVCKEIDWAVWSSVAGRNAAGTINSQGTNVNVTINSNLDFESSPQIWRSEEFKRYKAPIPNTTVPRTSWSKEPGGKITICFSQTVKEPILLLASLGSYKDKIETTISFSEPYVVLYNGGGVMANNSTSLTGREGYALIKFPGDISCVTINSSTYENFTDLTWGIPVCPDGTPKPASPGAPKQEPAPKPAPVLAAVQEPAPKPVPPAPKPAPVVAAVESPKPVPPVPKPAPVLAAVPEPAPKPVPPAPKPAPVVAAVETPKPVTVPKPAPVLAAVPEPAPKPVPPAPKPAPVVAAVETPKPVPVPKPAPVLAAVPEPAPKPVPPAPKPAPVIAAAVEPPKPVAVPKPASVLAAVPESAPKPVPPAPKPVAVLKPAPVLAAAVKPAPKPVATTPTPSPVVAAPKPAPTSVTVPKPVAVPKSAPVLASVPAPKSPASPKPIAASKRAPLKIEVSDYDGMDYDSVSLKFNGSQLGPKSIQLPLARRYGSPEFTYSLDLREGNNTVEIYAISEGIKPFTTICIQIMYEDKPKKLYFTLKAKESVSVNL
jgi:hypothetical protein